MLQNIFLTQGFVSTLESPPSKWIDDHLLGVDKWLVIGFIVSKDGITIDPLKVHSIIELPPPLDLGQLYSL
jgi:hypothetical protein